MEARVLTAGLAWLALSTTACGDGEPPSIPRPDGDDVPPEGLAVFDPQSLAMRGPFLQRATPDSITILWATDLPSSSRVQYGLTDLYGEVASGRTYRYGYGIDGDPPSGWLHEVVITGLEPSTTYHYRVVSLAAPTEDATFHTAPAAGEAFSIVVWGDTRTNHADHERVVDALVALAPDIAVFTGDLVDSPRFDDRWTLWFTIEAPLISRTPFYPAFGNHEGQGGGARYDHTFVAPDTALIDYYGEASARTYSFDYGALHVTVLDPYGDRTAVIAFLEEDLASPAARAASFRMITFHEPIYTFSYHRANAGLRDAVLPRARAGGVHVIATGHNHVYERFWLGDLHQLVVGGGGGTAHPLNGSTGLAGDTPDLRVAAYQGLSFVHATFAGDTATFKALTPDGMEIDCFQLDATESPPANRPCP